MKSCPTCQSTYEDWIEFCFNDGVPLVAHEPAAAPAAPRPAQRPAAPPSPSSSFDAPSARIAAGAELPEPAHLGRFKAVSSAFDAPEPVRPEPAAPAVVAEVLAEPTPLAAPLTVPGGGFEDPVSANEPDPSEEATSIPDMTPPPGVDDSAAVEPGVAVPPTAAAPPSDPPASGAAAADPRASGDLDADAMNELASALQDPAALARAETRPFLPPVAEESEDGRATVPLYTPMPSAPSERSVLDEEESRKKGGAGIGVALIGLLALGAVAIVGAGGIWWTMSRGSDKETVAVTPKSNAPGILPAAAPPPPVPPPAPPEVEPVGEPVAEVITEDVATPPPGTDAAAPGTTAEAAPASTTAAAPVATASTSRPATTTTRPPTSTTGANASTTSSTPNTRPASTSSTTPATAPSSSTSAPTVTSDSVWGTPAAPTSGFLRIITDPDSATVYVNDVAKGKTPVNIELPYGAHQIKVVRAGYKTEVRDVNIRVRELTVPFNLKPDVVTGQVNVYGPDGYRVVVDGHDMGLMPVTVQVSEGVRQFKLVGPDGNACNLPKEIKFKTQGRPETITLTCN